MVCFSNVLIVMVTGECYVCLSWYPANAMFDCHGNRRMLCLIVMVTGKCYAIHASLTLNLISTCLFIIIVHR